MKRTLLAGLILIFSFSAFSQTAPPADLNTIQQSFKKLNVLGSVLYMAAHPDDENTKLLAYLALEKHYRTGYLSLTRGDGGQNLIGTEQSELLGLVRTQELLAARRVDGAEQFFSRANDFGFSKGPEETLKIWDHEKVLGDAVWVIRKFRPDIIICRFPTTGEGGHGHHTSSAIIAEEAFKAAADPTRFPEQLKYVQTWQVKRLMWNTFNFGSANTTAPNQFKIDVGVYNPILGKSYGEIAAESRSNHKTQGFGSAKQRGASFEYFKTILGDAPVNDLMDGVNTTWSRVKGGDAIEKDIASIKSSFDIEHPEKSIAALVALQPKIAKIDDKFWKSIKASEAADLTAVCAGLWFEAYTQQPAYAQGDTINVTAQIISRTPGISLDFVATDGRFTSKAAPGSDEKKVVWATMGVVANKSLLPNQIQTFNLKDVVQKSSQPYWMVTPHKLGVYNIEEPEMVGNPENPDAPWVMFNFNISGNIFYFRRKLTYKYTDQAKGEIYAPIVIAPPVTANITSKDFVFNSTAPQTVQVKLQSFTNASGSVSLKPVAGWKISPDKIDFTNKPKGTEWVETFTIAPVDNKPKNDVLKAVVTVGGKEWSLGVQNINYDHIPAITLFPPAEAKIINIDLKTAGKKIGYIAGAGDLVAEAITQIGYEVHQLTENEIMNTDLSVYDAIITGVRAYNTNQRMVVEQPKLMEYVNKGGNLVVQYNVNQPLLLNNIGPYPFRVVNQRVTDENAKVTFLDPQHPVLNYPNKITQSDFDNWIQERGLYFVSNIDPRYKTILSMNDAGEAANPGSLIVGDYGKGRFVYTSLSFFRELPAGVPGAYRLFVNLLSKPR
jgi:LmbE family N-acetylglucosaminyl deacetylase